MKKLILLLLLLLLPSLGWATTYYVDSAITDTYVASATPDFTTYNPVTFATDTGTDSVYKTIADVNAKSFAAGDTVYFRKGQTWTGVRLDPATSGSSGLPITFDSFGSGTVPIIDGTGATGALRINGKSYITIRNLTLQKGSGACASLYGDNTLFEYNTVQNGGAENIISYSAAAHDITIRSCTITGANTQGIYVGAGADKVTIEDNVIYSNGTHANTDHGIYIQNGSNIIIRRNLCYSNYDSGIQVANIAAGADVLVERNKSYSNTGYGINLSTIADGGLVKINYNIIYSNVKSGIRLNSTNGVTIYNNTVFNSGSASGGAGLSIESTVINNIIKDNIFFTDYAVLGDSHEAVRVYTATEITTNTFDYNNVLYANHAGETGVSFRVVSPSNLKYTLATWQALTGSPDAHSISVDSVFVSTSTPDFHLQPTSPAINAGVDVGLTTDYSGNPIGTYPDIGAYEFQKNYTRGNYASLPLTDAQLSTEYSATEVTNASTSDTIRVGQSGGATQYIIHQFKNYASYYNSATVTWVGQSSLAPTSSTVYLQIYNQSSTTWETIDSDNVANVNTDFTLTTTVTPLTNYKDSDNYISCRVYQLGT